jgi:thiamine kinase-like enzyme
MIPASVLSAYEFTGSYTVQPFGSGHIHKTFKVDDADKSFILQRINQHVFKKPELITHNIQQAAAYLQNHYPDYLFLSILKSKKGLDLVYDEDGNPWRLLSFIENTYTVNEISSPDEAFEAAKGFARLTHYLEGCDPGKFYPTIEKFHNLGWRYKQFTIALENTTEERLAESKAVIGLAREFSYLVDEYTGLIASNTLVLRVTHNDTKINNILFDRHTRKAACVIDLDTLMPGYFIYDLGDMVRTFVSSSTEEELQSSKIEIRGEIYHALTEGYLAEMNSVLSPEERTAIPFAGLMMTYIIGLRFLTDFLEGDVYFNTTYPGQNLNRALGQFKLLEQLQQFHAK